MFIYTQSEYVYIYIYIYVSTHCTVVVVVEKVGKVIPVGVLLFVLID